MLLEIGLRAIVSVPFTSGSSLQLEAEIYAYHDTLRFSSLYIGILAATEHFHAQCHYPEVSVPFTSGSSLQQSSYHKRVILELFQFPLHRDPRCNLIFSDTSIRATSVSVPFTSGSSLQLAVGTGQQQQKTNVSVPFTSGSSLQPAH